MGVRAFVRVCCYVSSELVQSSRVHMGNETPLQIFLSFLLFLCFFFHFLFTFLIFSFPNILSLRFETRVAWNDNARAFVTLRVSSRSLEARESLVEQCWKNVNCSVRNFESSVLSNW